MRKSNTKKVICGILAFCLLFAGCSTANENISENASEENSAVIDEAGNKIDDTEVVTQPEGYPEDYITWIVPAAAGTAIDVPTRTLIEVLDVGETVIVENIPGASQTLGTIEAKNREADGYTLLTGANGSMLLQPSQTEVGYDTFQDFRHIAMIATPDPMAIAVSADSDIDSIETLLARLDAGERLTWSFSNVGGVGHLAFMDICTQKGYTSAEFVPFNGSAEVETALLGGHLDFIVMDASVIAQRVANNQMKALAVIASEENDRLPGVPCMSEYGIENVDSYQGYKWLAIRSDTPNEIVEWIKAKVNEATQTDVYQRYLEDNYFGKLDVYTEEEITEILKSSYESCEKVLDSLGMHK